MNDIDLTGLKTYLISKLSPDLVVDVVLAHRERSDVSTEGTHIQVTITNTHRTPPLTSNYFLPVERFLRGGVHVFDIYIPEWLQDLTRP